MHYVPAAEHYAVALIAGSLICSGAQLRGRDQNGDALIADRLKVGGSVLFNARFNSAGCPEPGATRR